MLVAFAGILSPILATGLIDYLINVTTGAALFAIAVLGSVFWYAPALILGSLLAMVCSIFLWRYGPQCSTFYVMLFPSSKYKGHGSKVMPIYGAAKVVPFDDKMDGMPDSPPLSPAGRSTSETEPPQLRRETSKAAVKKQAVVPKEEVTHVKPTTAAEASPPRQRTASGSNPGEPSAQASAKPAPAPAPEQTEGAKMAKSGEAKAHSEKLKKMALDRPVLSVDESKLARPSKAAVLAPVRDPWGHKNVDSASSLPPVKTKRKPKDGDSGPLTATSLDALADSKSGGASTIDRADREGKIGASVEAWSERPGPKAELPEPMMKRSQKGPPDPLRPRKGHAKEEGGGGPQEGTIGRSIRSLQEAQYSAQNPNPSPSPSDDHSMGVVTGLHSDGLAFKPRKDYPWMGSRRTPGEIQIDDMADSPDMDQTSETLAHDASSGKGKAKPKPPSSSVPPNVPQRPLAPMAMTSAASLDKSSGSAATRSGTSPLGSTVPVSPNSASLTGSVAGAPEARRTQALALIKESMQPGASAEGALAEADAKERKHHHHHHHHSSHHRSKERRSPESGQEGENPTPDQPLGESRDKKSRSHRSKHEKSRSGLSPEASDTGEMVAAKASSPTSEAEGRGPSSSVAGLSATGEADISKSKSSSHRHHHHHHSKHQSANNPPANRVESPPPT